MQNKDIAICLRSVDYSETSQILTLFTKSMGKISVIAKGIKRKKSNFTGPIEPLSYGEIIYSLAPHNTLGTLIEFQHKWSPVLTCRNYSATNYSLLACELIDSLTDCQDPHPKLFDNFLHLIQTIQNTGDQTQAMAMLIAFELLLLQEIGLGLILQRCANCNAKPYGQMYFSSKAGGLICRDCQSPFMDKIKISSAILHCLSNLSFLAQADMQLLTKIEKILIDHFTEYMHRQPKMAKMVLENRTSR